jgi:hypothetical protein
MINFSPLTFSFAESDIVRLCYELNTRLLIVDGAAEEAMASF